MAQGYQSLGGQDRSAQAPDDTTIAYTVRNDGDTGSAVPVLLIHALAQDRSNWDCVMAVLGDRCRVMAVDCRGHGASGAGEGPFDVFRFADDLIAVLDVEGCERAVVAGCSMGGCVALAMASRYPERVCGLVLVDTTAWYGEDAVTTWGERARKGCEEGLESLVPFQRDRWFSDVFRRDHPARVDQAVEVFLRNEPDSYAKSCTMLGQVDLREAAARVRVPAHILVGEQDYATPPAAAHALSELLAHSELKVLPGARHFTPIEEPHPIAEAIIALARSAGEGSAR